MTREDKSSALGGGESPLEDVLKKLGDHLREGGFFQTASTDAGPELEADAGAEPRTETTIGGFRLIKPLGRGGMGEVWEAEEVAIGRRVALKLLHPHIELSNKGLERFEREAQAGGKLSHPGIVQVLSVGESDGRHYLAQELVLGSITLADTLGCFRDGDELPEGYYRRLAVLFVRIGRGLAHVHEQGVVHRDIKPSNILIGPNDQPKVADFGLAMIEDSLSLSRTGEFMGTPFYMSPEQAASKRMGIDHRTDIFSLGATLYEALTLVRPFTGDTSQQVFQQILLVDPSDPKELRSRVSQDLATICLRALEKVPDKRYATMADLVEDLERYLSDRPILAKPPTALQRAVKWSRRNPTKSVAGAMAVFALILVSFLFVVVQAQNSRLKKVQGLMKAIVLNQKPENALGDPQLFSELISEHIADYDTSDLKAVRDFIYLKANNLWQEGEWFESYKLFQSLVKINARCYGENSLEYHAANGWVALYEYKYGDVNEAVRIQGETLVFILEELGPLHDGVLQTQSNYGEALWKAGDAKEGLRNIRASYEQRLHLCQNEDGANSHSLALSATALGTVLGQMGELDQAETAFLNGLHLFGKEFPDSPTSIWMKFAHADLLDLKGERDKATRLLFDALERCERVLPGHPDLLMRKAAFEERDKRESLGSARERVQLNPSSAEAHDILAWTLLVNSEHVEAAAESARALELAPESAKEEYQGRLDRLREMIKEARAVEER